MRIIALDVHRTFAQMAVLEDGKIRNAGKIDLEHNRLLQFAKRLKPDDEIIIEATGNTSAIVRLLSPFVGRVIIANPILVRAIAWAKVKTDKIDAAVLAKLHASGFLPEVLTVATGAVAQSASTVLQPVVIEQPAIGLIHPCFRRLQKIAKLPELRISSTDRKAIAQVSVVVLGFQGRDRLD